MDNISERLDTILDNVLFRDDEIVNGELPESAVLVDGLMHKFGFHALRLESHRDEIKEIMRQMPKQFFRDSGGGWSTLNLCMTEGGEQWGEHRNVELLVAFAVGLKLASYLMPRDTWKIFPGGMPYVVFENIDVLNQKGQI